MEGERSLGATCGAVMRTRVGDFLVAAGDAAGDGSSVVVAPAAWPSLCAQVGMAEAGAGEAIALPHVSEERSSDAPSEAIDDTAELANRIIAAAELDDAEAMEELRKQVTLQQVQNSYEQEEEEESGCVVM